MRIAILASGTGTNAQAIIDKARQGKLQAEIGMLASNRPHARALERWTPAIALDHKSYADRLSFDMALLNVIQEHKCDTVVLAGYMRLLSAEFLRAFPDHVLNIHPALLPSFPGAHGIDDAINYGVKLTGPSVHFVEEKMDSGPLIIQAACPVQDGESPEDLAVRVHALEHRIYPQALQWLAEGRLSRRGRRVILERKERELAETPRDALIWPPLEKGF